MLLAHISDTHFRSRGEKLYGFIDVNAANADVVSQLNALRERPDAVVVSGDIVNCGRPGLANNAIRCRRATGIRPASGWAFARNILPTAWRRAICASRPPFCNEN